MKFISNKIYLGDTPKSFGDLCKEASLNTEEMTKVAQAGMMPDVPVVEPEAEETDSGEQEIPAELMEALNELKESEEEVENVLADDSSPLKVASIDGNDDGTVTVNFDKSANIEDLLEDLKSDESDESEDGLCPECDGEGCLECEEETVEACSYAKDYGKFVKVANLTSNQKGYFKDYWASVWPEEFIDALLLDQ